MTQLLVATTNPAKLAEYRILLAEFGIEPRSLADCGIAEAPAETGATFAENALLKARFYFDRAQMPTLADDGGFEVDALGGEPGVRSHRWLGEGRSQDVSDDRALAEEVIRRMQGVEPGRRAAQIRAAVALVYRDDGRVREAVAEAAIEGVVPERAFPRIRPGFPYRAVLFLPERGRYLAELGEEEEAQLSQRKIALEKLRADLERIAGTRAARAGSRA
jgi:XTP/dITP diphosphohydrolase